MLSNKDTTKQKKYLQVIQIFDSKFGKKTFNYSYRNKIKFILKIKICKLFRIRNSD